METHHLLSDHRRVVGLELYQETYYICTIDIDTDHRTIRSGSLRVRTAIDRLAAQINPKDLVLLQDDHPRYWEAEQRLFQQQDVTVIVGKYSQLGAIWLKAGTKRGRAMSILLAEYLLASAEDGVAPSVKAPPKKAVAKRLLQLGLYMKELTERNDRIQKNLDDLLSGHNLGSAVEQALEMEISYRKPLSIESMKIPTQLPDDLLEPREMIDDDSFLGEYQKLLEEIETKS